MRRGSKQVVGRPAEKERERRRRVLFLSCLGYHFAILIFSAVGRNERKALLLEAFEIFFFFFFFLELV